MGHIQNGAGNDRGDRARAVLAFIAALVLMVTCVIRNAFADVIWIEQTQQHMHAMVGPWERTQREQALCEFLGVDWDSLSSQVKNSILTEDNGSNAFTTLLTKTLNMQYEYYRENPAIGGDGVIGNVVGSVQQTTYNVWCTLFGEDNLWDVDCTNAEYEAAKTLIYKYMYPNDGNSGGSGEGGGSGGTGTVMPSGFYTGTLNGVYEPYSGVQSVSTRSNASLSLNESTGKGSLSTSGSGTSLRWQEGQQLDYYLDPYSQGVIQAKLDQDGYTNVYFIRSYGSSYIFVADGVIDFVRNTNNDSNYYPKNNTENTIRVIQYNSGTYTVTCDNDIYSVYYLNITQARTFSIAAGGTYTLDYKPFWINVDNSSGGGGEDDDPYVPTPDPEPQPPTPPTPPRGPTGTGDTYTHTDYDVDITVDFPEYNEYGGNLDLTWTIYFTANTGLGQTVEDILRLILEELRDFRRDVYDYWHQLCENMEAISNAIQQTIDWQIGELQTALEAVDTDIVTQLQENKRSINDTMSNRLQWLNDNIVTAINEGVGEILGEIYQDAMYIADSLNFSAEFDDKNIVNWLKKIYSRLGSKPVIKNPTEDPKGWFDDLKKLLETILETALAGVDTAALATLWNTAKSHFPLSLPWDMLAIVGLLAHEPITPAVDYPIVFNGETIAEIEFDLSDYEDVADISRKMSLIVFAMGLLITYPQIFHTLEPLTKALRG